MFPQLSFIALENFFLTLQSRVTLGVWWLHLFSLPPSGIVPSNFGISWDWSFWRDQAGCFTDCLMINLALSVVSLWWDQGKIFAHNAWHTPCPSCCITSGPQCYTGSSCSCDGKFYIVLKWAHLLCVPVEWMTSNSNGGGYVDAVLHVCALDPVSAPPLAPFDTWENRGLQRLGDLPECHTKHHRWTWT